MSCLESTSAYSSARGTLDTHPLPLPTIPYHHDSLALLCVDDGRNPGYVDAGAEPMPWATPIPSSLSLSRPPPCRYGETSI